jgi:regulator of protease activity HflC (stomatin/prohibitin superfamily)
MLELLIPLLCVLGVVGLVVVIFSLRIAQQYERAVVFRLGKVLGVRGPGVYFLFPFADRPTTVDIRVVALDVPSQEAITKDNVTLKVNAVVYYQVVDPVSAIVNVEDFRRATWQIAQTSLRNVIGQSELDELLSERDQINGRLRQIIDAATEPWGVQVNVVEVKDVELPDNMKRAMAQQAEAERERRAKIINAEGELQSAERLAAAAHTIALEPAALQLRYLQTLREIAAENNSTVLFPIPVDIISYFMRGSGASSSRSGPSPQETSPDTGPGTASAAS